MSEWRQFSIEELGELLNSRRIPVSSTERSSRKGNYPYYGASGIVDYVNDFIFEGEHVLISEDGENLRTRKTPIAFLADGRFWVNNHAHIVKCHSGYLSKLIVYYFANLDLNQYITGAVQPKLSKSSLCCIPISLPESPGEQKAISDVLSSLDDKIDLLRRQNKTLEAMAETLFRQWFVENSSTSAKTMKLGQVIETCSGGTPSRAKIEFYENGSIRWVKSKELLGSFVVETEERITDEALRFSAAKLLPENSVLVALYGATVGAYAILAEPMACNQAVCAVMPSDRYPHTFLFMYFKHSRDDLINMAVGSAQQNISQVLIRQLDVPSDIERIREFHVATSAHFDKIKLNMYAIQTLAKLRNALLPKLMSGEVRVQYE